MKLLTKLFFMMLSLTLYACIPTMPTITSGGQNVKIIDKDPPASCQYLTEVVSFYRVPEKPKPNVMRVDVTGGKYNVEKAHEIVLKNNIAEVGGNTGALIFSGYGVHGVLEFYAAYHCN